MLIVSVLEYVIRLLRSRLVTATCHGDLSRRSPWAKTEALGRRRKPEQWDEQAIPTLICHAGHGRSENKSGRSKKNLLVFLAI